MSGVIDSVRADREDLARVLKKHAGIRRMVEDLYPDRAHFLYELLQNAEDTGATEVHFHLSDAALSFTHNGRAFDENDLRGITDIGEGTKAQDDDKIGRFGIGFKAVFAYTETPRVWCPTFCFEISDLVLPATLPPKSQLGERTQFEFPFNSSKKPKDVARREVEEGLEQFAETTLLFLTSIASISWVIEGGTRGGLLRVQHSEHHIEILRQRNAETTWSVHYLRFTRPLEGLARQNAAVAYELEFRPDTQKFDNAKPLKEQIRIVPARPGRVAIFFPAEKEASGLRFHLHAPFVPELSRASVKDTPANLPLFQALAMLSAESMHAIRDLGLLSVEFLEVLPNSTDVVMPRFECIRAAIHAEFQSKPLTPTHAKSHAPARQLLQGPPVLKALLNADDLVFLGDFREFTPAWVASAPQRNSNPDRFLRDLSIEEWNIDSIIGDLADGLGTAHRWVQNHGGWVSAPIEEYLQWLSAKPLEWHQKMYAMLWENLDDHTHTLKKVQIVRLQNGNYSIPTECFFASPDIDSDSDDLPRVDAGVYKSGKSKGEQDNARNFLMGIGVREAGEVEAVETLLKTRYRAEQFAPRIKDILRFVRLVESDPSSAKLFRDYYIFKNSDGSWSKPSQLFLDGPFLETGLGVYFSCAGKKVFSLSDDYLKAKVSRERFCVFVKAVGVQWCLEPVQCTVCDNPSRDYLYAVGGERYTSPIDRDWIIPGLDKFLVDPDLARTQLVWQTMLRLRSRTEILEARYQRSERGGMHSAPSQLVHTLRQAKWVLQTGGAFVKPCDADRALLPEGFGFDSGWEWIKAIGFGHAAKQQAEVRVQKRQHARELGFTDEDALSDALEFARLPAEERKQILARKKGRDTNELPQSESSNPDRRAKKVKEQAAGVPERQTDIRQRSVSVDAPAAKEAARAYLRSMYTLDGDMYCQACRDVLPFKTADGKYYFEAVEFIEGLTGRHHENFLAMCPNHAAMLEHACERPQVGIDLSGPEVRVTMAEVEFNLHFTKDHLSDLRAVQELYAVSQLASHVDDTLREHAQVKS